VGSPAQRHARHIRKLFEIGRPTSRTAYRGWLAVPDYTEALRMVRLGSEPHGETRILVAPVSVCDSGLFPADVLAYATSISLSLSPSTYDTTWVMWMVCCQGGTDKKRDYGNL
jgi:hypothetical protein